MIAKISNKAFIEIQRVAHRHRPVTERKNDFAEVEQTMNDADILQQAQRCMNCGIPFCHGSGCPLGNPIPDFNACVVRGDWRGAWRLLDSTSSLPEFTSRLCPALCEGSCCAGLDFGAVSVRQIEKAIVENAFTQGWVRPDFVENRTGRTVAVIGSGPAGLTAAKELNRQGYSVTVFECNHRPGGLLRYGIPDFKLPKGLIDRRVRLMEESGIKFVCDTRIGVDVSGQWLAHRFDHIVVAAGTPTPRDLDVPGRKLKGVHLALDFLQHQNRLLAGESIHADLPLEDDSLDARGRNVLVIGGGDTGSDCVGTAIRQGALGVVQIEIMPKPPTIRGPSTPWPAWPYMLRTSSSHEEGCTRRWDVNTIAFDGENGRVCQVRTAPVQWSFNEQGRPVSFKTLMDKETSMRCDLVLLALGFLPNDRQSLLNSLGIPNESRVVLAGDASMGPSLVVRAIADARKIVQNVNLSDVPGGKS